MCASGRGNTVYDKHFHKLFVIQWSCYFQNIQIMFKASKYLKISIPLPPNIFTTPPLKWTSPNSHNSQPLHSSAVAYAQISKKSSNFTKIHTNSHTDSQNVLHRNQSSYFGCKTWNLTPNIDVKSAQSKYFGDLVVWGNSHQRRKYVHNIIQWCALLSKSKVFKM